SSGTRDPARARTRRRMCTRTSRSSRRRPPSTLGRTARRSRASRAPLPLPLPDVQHGEKGLLRNFHGADLLHPLLALLLLLEQLPLARDVAAVALREHILAPRLHGLARDHARADR